MMQLQRSAGNVAVGQLVAGRQSGAGNPILRPGHQQVDAASPAGGPRFTASPVPTVERGLIPVQRDDLASNDGAAPTVGDTAQDGSPDAGKLDTGSGTFVDNISTNVQEVPIGVRQNAAEFNNNLQARFSGGDGGETSVAQVGTVATDLDANGNVKGATVGWTITEKVPTVAPGPGTAITQPAAAAELAAAQALAARIRQHEDSHASNETTGRTGFAQTLKGIPDSGVDAKLTALCKAVGTTQRALDNQEGLITLDANNAIQVSGKDHPEYVTGC